MYIQAILIAFALCSVCVAQNGGIESEQVTERDVRMGLLGDKPLEPFFSTTVNGNYVAAGVGLRATGSGSIHITGIPHCSTVKKAFLFWVLLAGNSAPNSMIVFEGHVLHGTLKGHGADPCWSGTTDSYVFVADVTAFVTGNGHYDISGLPAGAVSPLTEGASLVVIYETLYPGPFPKLPQYIKIWVGAATLDQNIIAVNTTLVVNPVCTSGDVKTTFIVADGQIIFSDTTLFQTFKWQNKFQENPEGSYMDTDTYNVKPLVVPGQTSLVAGISRGTDCLVWAAQVFTSPVCPVVIPDSCCTYTQQQLDLILFVAQERLVSGVAHINNIFEAAASCWDNAIAQVCGLYNPPYSPACAAVAAAYKQQVQNAKDNLAAQALQKRDEMTVITNNYKAMITPPCSEAASWALLMQFGQELEDVMKSMDLVSIGNEVVNGGQSAFGNACQLTNNWLCSVYPSQCGPAGTQAKNNAILSLQDAITILNQQIIVSQSGLPIYC